MSKKKPPNENLRKRENISHKKKEKKKIKRENAKKKKTKNIAGRTFSSTPTTHEVLLIFF